MIDAIQVLAGGELAVGNVIHVVLDGEKGGAFFDAFYLDLVVDLPRTALQLDELHFLIGALQGTKFVVQQPVPDALVAEDFLANLALHWVLTQHVTYYAVVFVGALLVAPFD